MTALNPPGTSYKLDCNNANPMERGTGYVVEYIVRNEPKKKTYLLYEPMATP